MKFSINDSSLRDKAMEVFKRHSTNWDEDIQERAIEYSRMLKMIDSNSDSLEFIKNIFDTMPTFPEEIQNNSVLIRRMNVLKKKGLSVGGKGKEDKDIAETKGEEFKSTVSAALSKSKSTDVNKEPSSKGDDLLFGGDEPTTSAVRNNDDELDLLGMGLDMGGASLESKSSVHPFIRNNSDHFVPRSTVDLEDEATELSIDGAQDTKWKNLIPGNSTDGTVYEDDEIKINVKFNVTKYLMRVLVEYVSMSSEELSDIQAKLISPDGVNASISATKYPQSNDENPKAMLMVMPSSGFKNEIKMGVRYQTSFGDKKTISFKVPVLINKFIEKVEMDQDRFDYLWNDISTNRPDSFEKLDLILKNPASRSSTDHMEVLKKLAKLFAV